MAELLSIIKRPVMTERATNLKTKHNQFIFRVAPASSKRDIRLAVEKLFKVKVVGVNTLRVKGKARRMGNAPSSYRSDWKKAIITVQAGQEIKVLEEGQG